MNDILENYKKHIKNDNIKALNSYSEYLVNTENMNFGYIYQKMFNYACQFGSMNIIVWFIQVYYEFFTNMEQIALRQSFVYGKYIMNKNNMIDKKWYIENVLELFKNDRI